MAALHDERRVQRIGDREINKSKMETNKTFRHGDLVINKVESTDIKLNKVKSAVLAEGEHTGHSHQLKALTVDAKIEFSRLLDKSVFKISGGQAILTHEEHKQIVFDPGTYTVEVKREFDYFQNMITAVRD